MPPETGTADVQDGNIHCHINNVSSKAKQMHNRSVVAAASYNCGQAIYSDREGRSILVKDRQDVIFTEIAAPLGAPDWAYDRARLWNRVETSARRKDARLAKKIEVAFTRDVPASERVTQLRAFAAHFVKMGCVVDAAIHADTDDHNPHAHILLTTFALAGDGFGGKLTALESRQFVKDTRRVWAELTNAALQKCGSPLRVDHRSYKARGIGLEPTRHRGPELPQRAFEREPAHAAEAAPQMNEDQQGEDLMDKPTDEDKRKYPHLAARETWPPEREPAADMSEAVLLEHTRYWDDQDAWEIERLANDFNIEHDPGYPTLEELEPVQDKFSAALSRARAEQEHPEEDVVLDLAPKREPRRDYQDDVYRRAVNLNRTKNEQELLDMVRNASPEMKQFVVDHIIDKRMQRIRDEDKVRRLRELEKEMTRTEKEHLRRIAKEAEIEEYTRPEPGPGRELVPFYEIEQARDDMIEEVERERER